MFGKALLFFFLYAYLSSHVVDGKVKVGAELLERQALGLSASAFLVRARERKNTGEGHVRRDSMNGID